MKIYTIGFTNKKAKDFFEKLSAAGVKRVVDVRLNNVSQLSGFSKRDDIRYFLHAIAGIDYVHAPELAPTQEMLDTYKKQKGEWAVYERDFLTLMENRRVETGFQKESLDEACLLCSEDKPHHCHRRLVAEYLQRRWQGVSIEHLY
jgi:uncharacterized protein (DUF488 family)